MAQLSQLFGWQEEEYLSLLEEAQRATSAKAMAAGYHRAGGMATGALLRFAGRASSSYEATNQDLEGITFLPDGTPSSNWHTAIETSGAAMAPCFPLEDLLWSLFPSMAPLSVFQLHPAG